MSKESGEHDRQRIKGKLDSNRDAQKFEFLAEKKKLKSSIAHELLILIGKVKSAQITHQYEISVCNSTAVL